MMLSRPVIKKESSPEWARKEEKVELSLDILKAIYSDTFTLTPAIKRDSICYWINDEEKAYKMLKNHQDFFDQDKKTIVFVSCRHSFHLMNKNNIEVIDLKEGSLDTLVIGYFRHYLQSNTFPKALLGGNERSLRTYEELLYMYTKSFVMQKTGLNKESIELIYDHLQKKQPHHHLMMSDDFNEKNVQSIRTICMLPLFQEKGIEDSCEIPVTFDWVFGKLHFKIGKGKENRNMAPTSILNLKVKEVCSERLVDDCKKTFINLYDLAFADKFDVDPFPVSTL